MKYVSIHFFIIVLIGRRGSFSIRFEEYRRKVPSVLVGLRFDGFNEIDCHRVGSNCSTAEECCGPADCVLPSWSPTMICLLPGLKGEGTLEEVANGPVTTEVNEQINTIEDILKSVKVLSDKLNQLTYEGTGLNTYPESSLNLNPPVVGILSDSSTNRSFLPYPTTEPTGASKKIRKISKWNVVKALFLRKRTHKTLASADDAKTDKTISGASGLKVFDAEKDEGIDVPDKFPILKIFGSFHSKKSTQTPRSLVHGVPIGNAIAEQIGDVNTKQHILNTLMKNADNSHEETENDLKKALFSGDTSVEGIFHRANYDNDQNSTFHLPHDTNNIANILYRFRNWFSTPSHELQTTHTKYFRNEITTPSSVSSNKAENLGGLKTNPDVLDTDYSDRSDLSGEYSENKERLYNNSYVFIIKHKNETYNKSESKWNRLVHFLHSVKLNPRHRDPEMSAQTTEMTSEILAANASHLVEVLSNRPSKDFTPNITIKIPENLMPEALEAEQPDLTELLFSSNYYEDYGELNA